jgi:iron complex transport system permease protein
VEVRLPRALLGLLVGAALGLSGAALQGWLRNPLAEPGLIGVSSGAALGAVIAFYFGLASLTALAVPLMGMIGALAAVVLLYLLAGQSASTSTLILAGIAISAFAGALTSLALNLAPNPYAVTESLFWLLGSLSDRSMSHVMLAGPFILLGMGLLLLTASALDALSLGEEVAASLGINLPRNQLMLIAGIALSIGAATAVTGIIGFIGLVAPHLIRPFAGARPSRVLILGALSGASLLLAADLLVRIATPQQEIKLGILTALLGAPFFLILILNHRRGQSQ